MVDISSQNNKINITVSSSGNTANTNVTPDYAQYYSEKSKEWAISNKIVDNTDYSSKHYANESKKQADISTAKTTEVVESGNNAVSNIESARDNAIIDITNQENLSVDNVNTAGATQVALATEQATIATNKTSEVVASGNNALSNIDTAKDNAITTITTQETTSKTSLIDEGATQIGLIQNEGATQIANVQSTGFYMRDDKLYYINSQGEETEFKLDDIELNNPYSLFDSKYSDHELNNLSWLKSEGQWNAKAVYTDAYDKLLKVYNGTETVEGLSVKLSTEEYTDYDFVLNTTDETFRLPLKTLHTDDTVDSLSLYFYVGETVQNANLIDAGRIGEQLAGKVDLDLANLSSEGKEAMTAYWIASGSPTINIPINLTISTTTQYWEAPSNGYVWFYMASASSGAVGFIGVKEEHPDLWSIGNIGRGWLYINKGQHLSVRTDVGTFTLGVLLFTAKQ